MKRIALVLIVCLCASGAQALLCPFTRITNNSFDNIAGQLCVEITDEGLSGGLQQVAFKFTNTGPIVSSIAEIYFYDGVFLDMYSINDSLAGVDFEDIGSSTAPPTLPGYDPEALVVFGAADAENPPPKKGVNPGEWVTISYTLLSGKTYNDFLAGMASGDVVLGVHVISIPQPEGGTTSDSFITPEPATMVLLGLGGLTLLRKKK